MRGILRSLCALSLCATLCGAQTKSLQQSASTSPRSAATERAGGPNEATAKLPVRRVVLYKNGVGYFEHLGRVRGSQDVHIDFTSAQLNDVLKSLTVLDLSGGRITGVDYNSEAPLARRLATLRLALGERPTVADFLKALRGARLEVRGGTAPAVAGRLLSVERKTRTGSNWTLETDEISLITDTGEVRTVDLSPATIVRIAERELNVEVGRYLALIASSRDQDLRRMTVSTAGSGERNLYVSYISEVPIWKTTYRIVLPSKPSGKPLLQGWAIVDNTVGEDWDNVELSLVAGAPHSFIQQLSQPYYGRRPVVPLPESVQLTPQTHAATLVPGGSQLNGQVTDPQGAAVANATVRVLDENNQVMAETTADDDGNYNVEDLPVGNYHIDVFAEGFATMKFQNVAVRAGTNTFNANLNLGAATETVTVSGAGGGVGRGVAGGVAGGLLRTPKSGLSLVESTGMASKTDRFEAARSAAEPAAHGQELGDLFEYKLKERVTIRKNQSALVPIVQTDIAAEKVSMWGESYGTPRPLRAVWVTNSSALTLDGGSFSVLEDETFGGEGLTDPIKPGERRLLSYATDLGVLVDTRLESEQQRVTRVKIVHGVMTHISELRERKTYTVRNEDTSFRILILEHPTRPEWKLADDAPKPEEKAAGSYRFRLAIEPKKTAKLVVHEVRPLETTFALTNLNDDLIALFLQQKTINEAVEKELRRIVAQKGVVAGFDREIQSRKGEVDRIFADQQRLRENLKALKGSAEEKALTQRYTQQLADQETRLDTLRKEVSDLDAQRSRAQVELDRMIQELKLDVTL